MNKAARDQIKKYLADRARVRAARIQATKRAANLHTSTPEEARMRHEVSYLKSKLERAELIANRKTSWAAEQKERRDRFEAKNDLWQTQLLTGHVLKGLLSQGFTADSDSVDHAIELAREIQKRTQR